MKRIKLECTTCHKKLGTLTGTEPDTVICFDCGKVLFKEFEQDNTQKNNKRKTKS